MCPTERIRLDSWKSIAEYLDRNVRTVTRWADERGLPVHRVPGGKRRAVFAYSDEIDGWLTSQSVEGMAENETRLPPEAAPGERLSDEQLAPIARRSPSSRGGAGFPTWLVFGLAGCLVLGLGAAGMVVVRGRHAATATPPLTQLTNDGRRKIRLRLAAGGLFFNEFVGIRQRLYSLPANGGALRELSVPIPNATLQDVSSDGQRLLLTPTEGQEAANALWIVSLATRRAERVGDLECNDARWSADGRRIACAHGQAIELVNEDGSNAQQIEPLPSFPWRLAWSPDGNRVRFALGPGEGRFADPPWEIRVESKQPLDTLTRLSFAEKCCGAWDWTESGNRFLYLRQAAAGEELTTIRDGDNPLQPPSDQEGLPIRIGTAIEFKADEKAKMLYLLIDHAKPSGQLFKVVSNGKALETMIPGLSASFIVYSPDHQWMTYTATEDHNLWISRQDGSEARPLTSSPHQVEISAWSPDGATIAYTRKSPGKPWRIMFIRPDGTGEREAIPGGTDDQGAPSWSADGKTLVYANVGCQELKTCELHLLNTETGKVTEVLGSQGLRTARFSPDGRLIAALQPELHELRLLSVADGRWKTLAANVTGDNIVWSADSEFIYADSPGRIDPAIEKFNVVGGQRTKVVDLAELEKMGGDTGNWFGLAPDGAPILLRLYTYTEVYALHWEMP